MGSSVLTNHNFLETSVFPLRKKMSATIKRLLTTALSNSLAPEGPLHEPSLSLTA